MLCSKLGTLEVTSVSEVEVEWRLRIPFPLTLGAYLLLPNRCPQEGQVGWFCGQVADSGHCCSVGQVQGGSRPTQAVRVARTPCEKGGSGSSLLNLGAGPGTWRNGNQGRRGWRGWRGRGAEGVEGARRSVQCGSRVEGGKVGCRGMWKVEEGGRKVGEQAQTMHNSLHHHYYPRLDLHLQRCVHYGVSRLLCTHIDQSISGRTTA